MKKVENILDFKKGTKIFRVDGDGKLKILEYLCEHPNNDRYSIFIDNLTKDPVRYFNDEFDINKSWYKNWYFWSDLDNDSDVWNFIHTLQMNAHQNWTEFYQSKIKAS